MKNMVDHNTSLRTYKSSGIVRFDNFGRMQLSTDHSIFDCSITVYKDSILQSTIVQPEMPLTTPLSRKHTTIWSNFHINKNT